MLQFPVKILSRFIYQSFFVMGNNEDLLKFVPPITCSQTRSSLILLWQSWTNLTTKQQFLLMTSKKSVHKRKNCPKTTWISLSGHPRDWRVENIMLDDHNLQIVSTLDKECGVTMESLANNLPQLALHCNICRKFITQWWPHTLMLPQW